MGLVLIGFHSLPAAAQQEIPPPPPLDGPDFDPIIQLPPWDGGVNPAGVDIVYVQLTIGDHSGSASESWRLHVGDFELTAPEGVVVSQVYTFAVGESYPVTVEWLGGDGDYDYTALVEPAFGGMHPIVIDDPQNLLGVHDCNTINCAAGKQATLHIPAPRLKAVTFGGTGHHPVIRDISQVAYEVPHWLDDNNDGDADDVGDHRSPVCYVQGSTMTITEVRFAIDPPAAAALFAQEVTQVVGKVGDQNLYVFAGIPVLQGNELVATNLSVSTVLADRIDKFTNGITWYLMLAGGGTVKAGRSDSVLYVTRAAPSVPTLFHTLLEIGCTGAGGLTSATPTQQVVDAIWGQFTSRQLERAENKEPMAYYYRWNCTNITPATMLASNPNPNDGPADGQCGAWARLFIETLAAQGIHHSQEHVAFEPDPNDTQANVIYVANWTFTGAGTGTDPLFPYLNVLANNDPIFPYSGSPPGVPYAYDFAFEETSDQAGVPGQETANPNSRFGNHQMVAIGTGYYDPSYGVRHQTDQDVENSLDGYVLVQQLLIAEATIGVDLNGDGDMIDVLSWWCDQVAVNPPGDQLRHGFLEWPP